MRQQRIRSLKPEIVEDEKVGPLSDAAFRLFVSLIVLSDDFGNARGDVRWLESQVWWARADRPNVLLALVELQRSGLVDAYGVRGGTYVHLRGWTKHQRLDNASKTGILPNIGCEGSVEIDYGRDLESPGRRVDSESPPELTDLESPSNQSVNQNSTPLAATRGEPPRNSESRGSDLDLEVDTDPEVDMDGAARDPSATPPANPKPKRGRPKAPSVPIPDGWAPNADHRSLARELGRNCDAEAERFIDHHRSKATLFADWNAAFRNWIRKSAEFAQGRSTGKQTTWTVEDQMARARKLEDEERAEREGA